MLLLEKQFFLGAGVSEHPNQFFVTDILPAGISPRVREKIQATAAPPHTSAVQGYLRCRLYIINHRQMTVMNVNWGLGAADLRLRFSTKQF